MFRRGFACGLLALVAHCSLAAGGDKYALVVGVRECPDAKGLRALPFSERDATELADALKANGFKRDNVILMTPARGTDAGGRFFPQSQQVKAELKKLLDGLKADDAVIVAFSGHGITTGDDAYLCPSDAKPDDPNTLLGVKDLYKSLGECKAGTRLVLVDAWRSDPAADDAGRPKLPAPPAGVAAVFSASEKEKSYDYEKLRHGAFFHFAIEGLNGEAADKDGAVTVGGLRDYLARKVRDYVRAESGVQQRPEAAGTTADKTVLVKLGKLSGKWSGMYFYPNDVQAAVDFEMKVVHAAGDRLTATVKEPNTFGPNPAQEPHLYAKCKGTFDGAARRLTWTKTYDGTDGISHSVEYTGDLSEDGKSVEGTWTIKDENGNEGFSGKFTLKRPVD
jgi:uncharacterized caspase-like protein